MKIKVDPSSCVRYYSKFSECKFCEYICPENAIITKESALEIYQDKCISCGACVGVCPVEALKLTNLSMPEFFFDFLKSDETVISCKTNFVCLSALNVEYLISLALIKEFVLDLGHCEECEIKERCFPKILENIDEANYVLSTISDKEIKAQNLCKIVDKETDRREFFNIFTLKGVVGAVKEVEDEVKALENPKVELPTHQIKAIREKNIPDKRKVLFTVLKKIETPKNYKYLENEYLTFISDKTIDDTCDNCSICYRICPTAALNTDSRFSKIYFDPMLCVKCHLCHDVCEKKSIKLSSYFDTEEFFESKQKTLKSFNIVRCDDCGNFFTYLGGEKLCQRCKIEEQEAKDLWGIS
ncbi:4Fe-4S binding protein [Nitrosophilus labii]|uniref:4Fe-4S binding protein n=1 Tax=Nitrosophilus labii TaxID=2706014 RepID=UPI0016574F3F|nr:4Fe-4S binding protein [Nitrosophilus labii]